MSGNPAQERFFVTDPNNPKHYLTPESVQRLESTIKISTDLSLVRFFLWTPEFGSDAPALEFNAETTAQDLLDHGFQPERGTKFISHGWNSHGESFAKPFVKGKSQKMTTGSYFVLFLFSLLWPSWAQLQCHCRGLQSIGNLGQLFCGCQKRCQRWQACWRSLGIEPVNQCSWTISQSNSCHRQVQLTT